jgi:hypothetical protein
MSNIRRREFSKKIIKNLFLGNHMSEAIPVNKTPAIAPE